MIVIDLRCIVFYLIFLILKHLKLEIDTWDGDDGWPIVYHGGTLTSKIPLRYVLKGIRDFCFVSSDLPLIISIENHCGYSQQSRMAELLKYYLGRFLLLPPDHCDTSTLPSPSALRRRILLKSKYEYGKTTTEFGSLLLLRSTPLSSSLSIIADVIAKAKLESSQSSIREFCACLDKILRDAYLISSTNEDGLSSFGDSVALPFLLSRRLLRVYPRVS